jgi:hypothetical protein
MHWPPLAPHIAADVVTHWPLAQQPAQLMVPQLHAPLVQVWPDAQVPQAVPPDPHALADCAAAATHRPWASQQPFGHDVGLQVQVPAGPQVCPVPHAAQAAPAVPHALAAWPVNARQVPFAWQQPFAHEVGVQAQRPVASQVCPFAQAAQAPPWLPHAWSVEGTHTPAAVQQPAHPARSHVHAPLVQAWDGAHAVQAAPAVPHAAAVVCVTHCPF